MHTDKIIAKKDGAIGRMTFNNPERRNAITLEMWQAMPVILDDMAADDAIRVIVVNGAGGKAFASGADISQFEKQRASKDSIATYGTAVSTACTALSTVEKPTIAMIEGYCIGGGLLVALCCDMRIVSDNSRFGIPAARLGLGYKFDSVRPLVDLVGPTYAKEILFTARQFDADEARQMGLVNRVLPGAALAGYVEDYAATIAANAPLTLLAVKKTIGEVLKDPDARDLALCQALTDACFDSADYTEGRQAFMEKRKPNFVGR